MAYILREDNDEVAAVLVETREPKTEERRPRRVDLVGPKREPVLIIQEGSSSEEKARRKQSERRLSLSLEASARRERSTSVGIIQVEERSPRASLSPRLKQYSPRDETRRYHGSPVIIQERSPRLSSGRRLSPLIQQEEHLRLPQPDAPLQLPAPQPYPVFIERPVAVHVPVLSPRSPRIQFEEPPTPSSTEVPPPAPDAPIAQPMTPRVTPPGDKRTRGSAPSSREQSRARSTTSSHRATEPGEVTTVTTKKTIYRTTYYADDRRSNRIDEEEEDVAEALESDRRRERRERRERRDHRRERDNQDPPRRSRSPRAEQQLMIEGPRQRDSDFGRLLDDRELEQKRRTRYLYS